MDQDTLTMTIMLSVFAITGVSIIVAWIPIWIKNRKTKGMSNVELLRYYQSRNCIFHPDQNLTISGVCRRCLDVEIQNRREVK